jgi:flagella synthesis protein FlgN
VEKFIDLLSRLLQQDLHELEILSRLLEQEKQALRNRDANEIQSLGQSKQELVLSLERRSRQKAQLLAKSPLRIRPGQVREKLVTLNNENLLQLWDRTQSAMSHCKERNLLNGKIISLSLQRTHRLMDLLRGQHSQPAIYGSQGKTHSSGGRSSLGKA